MTKEERITALEARIAQLEARIAQMERGSFYPVLPQPVYVPSPTVAPYPWPTTVTYSGAIGRQQ